MSFDGVTYNVFTDKELEEYKAYILLEKKLMILKMEALEVLKLMNF